MAVAGVAVVACFFFLVGKCFWILRATLGWTSSTMSLKLCPMLLFDVMASRGMWRTVWLTFWPPWWLEL